METAINGDLDLVSHLGSKDSLCNESALVATLNSMRLLRFELMPPRIRVIKTVSSSIRYPGPKLLNVSDSIGA